MMNDNTMTSYDYLGLAKGTGTPFTLKSTHVGRIIGKRDIRQSGPTS